MADYNTPFSPDLNIPPEDIPRLQHDLARLVPGYGYTVIDGRCRYQIIEEGTTKEGVHWKNIHIDYRENATNTIRARALPWLEGKGVDIGCGLEKITPDCIGIDSGHDYGDRCVADDIRDASDLTGYEDGQFDWVYSSNNLEHIENWEDALDEWVRVLRKGGTMFLYLPWGDKCPPLSAKECASHVVDLDPIRVFHELDQRGILMDELDASIDGWGCFVIVGRKA